VLAKADLDSVKGAVSVAQDSIKGTLDGALALWGKFDANGDGRLSIDEAVELLNWWAPPPAPTGAFLPMRRPWAWGLSRAAASRATPPPLAAGPPAARARARPGSRLTPLAPFPPRSKEVSDAINKVTGLEHTKRTRKDIQAWFNRADFDKR
jgi:hypothetical protein